MTQWAEKLNINVQVLARRLSRNWTIERALTTKVNNYNTKGGVYHI